MGTLQLSLYGLVLLAALAHAVWNVLVKSASDPLLMMAAVRCVGLIFGIAVLPFVPWPEREAWIWLASAAAAHFAYYTLLIHAYRLGDLSLVYPVARGGAPLLLALLALATIGERLTYAQTAGVLLISAGVLAIAASGLNQRAALLCAIGTSVAIAAYSYFGGVGVRAHGSVLGFQAWLEIITGIGMLAFVVARRQRSSIASFVRASGKTALSAGILSVGGYVAYLAAAKELPLATVAAVRESSVLFGAVLGAVVLREAFGLRRTAAATLVACGLAALAFATR